MLWIKGILVFIAVILLVRAFNQLVRYAKEKQQTTRQQQVKLVQCAHCGTHVPQGRTISKDGENYCEDCSG